MSDYSLLSVLRYLRRPYFPAGRDRLGEDALRHLLQLLFLSLAIMLVISPMILSIIIGVMGELPENANTTLGMENPGRLLVIGVLIAPVFEELVFRGWLGGRRACVIGLPALAVGLLVIALLTTTILPGLRGEEPVVPGWIGIGMIAVLVSAVLAINARFTALSMPERKGARWQLFPYAFYGSVVLFALLHLGNYEGGLSSPILLLAILPQAGVGMIFGYVRMRFGLPSAIVFHAAYNLILIGLVIIVGTVAAVENAAVIQILSV